MPDVTVMPAEPGDFDAICALNLAEVQHTSPMDLAQLTALDRLSCHHRVARVDGEVAAFLLAICSGAAYRNDNFEWFASRFERFLYVDRIVVSAAHRGLRLGTLLYDDVFRYARTEGFPFVTCEYNIVPPNEPSRRFHERFGFQQQGTQWVAGGTKQVSLQAAKT